MDRDVCADFNKRLDDRRHTTAFTLHDGEYRSDCLSRTPRWHRHTSLWSECRVSTSFPSTCLSSLTTEAVRGFIALAAFARKGIGCTCSPRYCIALDDFPGNEDRPETHICRRRTSSRSAVVAFRSFGTGSGSCSSRALSLGMCSRTIGSLRGNGPVVSATMLRQSTAAIVADRFISVAPWSAVPK